MRTPLLAVLLAFSLPACLAGEISDVGGEQGGGGGGGGGGDGDGNGGGGGDGSGDGSGTQNTPSVALSVDKTTVTSDLGVETTITISAMSVMGFTGDVDLTVTPAGADWTATVAQPKLTLAADATATTTLKLSALGDTATLTGDVKVTATSGAISKEATIGVSFNSVLAVTFADNGNGQCVYPVGHGLNNPWRLKLGRTIKVINGSPTLGFTVHTGNIPGFTHQNGSSPAGGAYMGTPTTTDVTDFYCHNNNGDTTTMKEQASTNRNYLRVVQ